MAKTRAVTVYRPPAASSSAPIINIPAPRIVGQTKPKRGGGGRRHRGGGGGGAPSIMEIAVAAGAVGMAKRAGLLSSLPEVPVVGRIGALAIGSYFWARSGGGKMAKNICTVATVLSAFQMASQGSIDGEEAEPAGVVGDGTPLLPGT